MIHLLPDAFDGAEALSPAATPYAEALARLASIRTALGIVEQVAGRPASATLSNDAIIAAGWPQAAPAAQRAFDTRSARVAAAAAAGLEAIAARHEAGQSPHPAAIERLARELGGGLADLDQLFSL